MTKWLDSYILPFPPIKKAQKHQNPTTPLFQGKKKVMKRKKNKISINKTKTKTTLYTPTIKASQNLQSDKIQNKKYKNNYKNTKIQNTKMDLFNSNPPHPPFLPIYIYKYIYK